MGKEKTRVNVYVTDETKEYLQDQADILGISVSGLINVCINTYKQQAQTLSIMTNIEDIVTQLKKLEKWYLLDIVSFFGRFFDERVINY